MDVLWSVNAQRYILQSNLQFPQLLRTIFDVADTLAASIAPDYRLLRPSPATSDALANVAAGRNALSILTGNAAAFNTAVGDSAMKNLTDCNQNIAIGANAMQGTSTPPYSAGGFSNIAIGNNSLQNITDGSGNICIGASCGGGISSGTKNTLVGSLANISGAGTNNYNVVLGYATSAPNLSGTLSVGGTGGNAMTNLTSASAGTSASLFLNIYLNGTPYKIQLLSAT